MRSLGGFTVWLDGSPVPAARWRRRKVAALFKCLLGAQGYRLQCEQLIDVLFPGAGAKALRSTIHLLHKTLDRPGASLSHLRGEGEWLALPPAFDGEPAALWLDAAAFSHAVVDALARRQPVACRAALALYGGDYLPSDRYEVWAERPAPAPRHAEPRGRHDGRSASLPAHRAHRRAHQ